MKSNTEKDAFNSTTTADLLASPGTMKISDENELQNAKRLKRAQILTFILTYLAYLQTHVQREFWAMSKEHVKV